MKTKYILPIIASIVFLAVSFQKLQDKPVLYIIGDSTVQNGSGKGADSLWGWGSFMNLYFNTDKIEIQNHAKGGRSSRTFITEGRWDLIMKTIKKGDYVLMQFGHNDGGELADTLRARGTIKGIGDESKDIYNPIRKVNETVYTYGHYMRKYANEAKSKGAISIIVSPIPRNKFDEKGKIGKDQYGIWAKEVAQQTDAYFLDLNTMVIEKYEKMGAEKVKAYFPKDHTHTNEAGAIFNAELVAKAIKDLKKCELRKYLK
ncbi:rhamnogalacturonan acetylesterase [Chryseobacterium sp. Ch-15]|uniref:Rhamnogalacturonan acetylesterase n=1 Tax=Chryseobacterium muglaense TaxID=2893752 RepID=A0A9Q3YSC8_9FLAO|nr:rhamnogalacturonan acetylesterase [Chryseobacterium muglaense]MBD3904759.1 rhamnogalacturonan acetylesterase [Chryseobacterium muglaense]MCC9033682.1 rhamnogalacturonan acetylesterase [Chryseobacterium muglaense]MCM2554757.1 rhamnogalacturonan acetylesterase [Chryseobacterium muglaense]